VLLELLEHNDGGGKNFKINFFCVFNECLQVVNVSYSLFCFV
jgi:hypothetical protein